MNSVRFAGRPGSNLVRIALAADFHPCVDPDSDRPIPVGSYHPGFAAVVAAVAGVLRSTVCCSSHPGVADSHSAPAGKP